MTGATAMAMMVRPPRWVVVAFEERTIYHPYEDVIVIAYRVQATRADGTPYDAYRTSTLHRLARDDWRLVQHQQTTPS